MACLLLPQQPESPWGLFFLTPTGVYRLWEASEFWELRHQEAVSKGLVWVLQSFYNDLQFNSNILHICGLTLRYFWNQKAQNRILSNSQWCLRRISALPPPRGHPPQLQHCVSSPAASWGAVVGQTQLHGDDTLHQQAREPEAHDEPPQGQESQHPVWSLPCLQGETKFLLDSAWRVKCE